MKFIASLILAISFGVVEAADTVPTEVQMPGTQPGEITNQLTPGFPIATRHSLDPTQQCAFCHANYNTAVEPGHNWGGSMMSQAARDPVFWATIATAEQDFNGAGDFCLRCHTSGGWLAGRSTPTDGSAMTVKDSNGVECDTCHRLTNPDGSELKGVQNPPFVANNGATPAVGHYGSAQYVMWGGIDKLAPYADSVTRHPSLKSSYHRSPELCGTCHDVSNPVTGDLAHNNGAQIPLAKGTFSGVLGAPVATKAAFNNFPYQFGVVERTYSEFKASDWPNTAVTRFDDLPDDLQTGAVKLAYDKAVAAGTNGDFEDGTTRFYTCQTCHMSPVAGQASSTLHNKPLTRKDMALHDQTGGNYWAPEAIKYLDGKGKLRLGGGLSSTQIASIDAGIVRAKANLNNAAALKVTGNVLTVTNLTGHKLISGYPEGRRMWLNIKWYDANNKLLREDGKYGPITVTLDGAQRQVNTLLDLKGTHTRIYEVRGSMTQRWAEQLLKMGVSESLPLSFDRVTGKVDYTLGDLEDQREGTYHETFHFVLNNYVAMDDRIPPYGMRYDEARKRNALPVPYCQFGCPSAGGTYDYHDYVKLAPPKGAKTASIDLLYQPTSWEYVQFLYLSNKRANAFLADEGANLLDAWLNTGMAQPAVMSSTRWTCNKRGSC